MFSVFEIAECFLLEVSINEKAFNVTELSEKTFKLLVVVLFNTADFLPHATKFGYLVFNFVLELGYFSREVAHVEFIQHDHIVLSVLTKQALETN